MKNKYSKYINDGTLKVHLEYSNNTLLEMLLDCDKTVKSEEDYVAMYEEILHRMNEGTDWVTCDCGASWIPHKHGKSQAGK